MNSYIYKLIEFIVMLNKQNIQKYNIYKYE